MRKIIFKKLSWYIFNQKVTYLQAFSIYGWPWRTDSYEVIIEVRSTKGWTPEKWPWRDWAARSLQKQSLPLAGTPGKEAATRDVKAVIFESLPPLVLSFPPLDDVNFA